MSRELVEVYYDEENEDRKTDLARLFVIGDDEVWIPKSQIEREERGRLGDGTGVDSGVAGDRERAGVISISNGGTL